VPILVDGLGEPVVARWKPSDDQQIWYVIPDAVDWSTVVGWIVQRALPEHVPAALRRVRSRHSVDADVETRPASRPTLSGRGRRPTRYGPGCCTAAAANSSML
jgi:hypothetical protein